MEFFSIFKRAKGGSEVKSAVQTAVKRNPQKHPFSAMEQYKPLSDCQIGLYKTMREAVPIIDAAISKIVRLVGEFKIRCEDPQIEYLINDFIKNVQVSTCGTGLNSFILSHLDQLITYGTAVGEIVINPNEFEISALYNSSLSNTVLSVDENNPLKLIVHKKKGDKLKLIKYPELLLISALNPEPGRIYGNSIMKGLPFVSSVLLKIYQTIGINWERVGNVRFAVNYKPPSDASDRGSERAKIIAEAWSNTMSSGSVNDFIAVGDVSIKVIGADNQILESQVPVRQMLEQIISKLSIPPFLLGLNWSTTETMSTQQAEILSSELEAYRRILGPVISKVCDTWLKINGYQTKYQITWDKIDLKDHLHIANARLINARARQIEEKLEKRNWDDEDKTVEKG